MPPVSAACPRPPSLGRSAATVEELAPELRDGRSAAFMLHAFNEDELARAGGAADCAAIVSHGVELELDGWARRTLSIEYAPVFVSSDNPLADLTLAALKSILSGETRSWSTLAPGFDEHVQVYLHGGDMQHAKFRTLLERAAIDPGLVAGCAPRFGATYEELEQAASEDPGAIVLGLKTASPARLRVVKLEGVAPLRPDSGTQYALTLPIYFLRREGAATAALEQQIHLRLVENARRYTRMLAGL
jgi:hypothetical protein